MGFPFSHLRSSCTGRSWCSHRWTHTWKHDDTTQSHTQTDGHHITRSTFRATHINPPPQDPNTTIAAQIHCSALYPSLDDMTTDSEIDDFFRGNSASSRGCRTRRQARRGRQKPVAAISAPARTVSTSLVYISIAHLVRTRTGLQSRTSPDADYSSKGDSHVEQGNSGRGFPGIPQAETPQQCTDVSCPRSKALSLAASRPACGHTYTLYTVVVLGFYGYHSCQRSA